MGRCAPTVTLVPIALLALACGEPRPIQHDGKRSEPAEESAAETAIEVVGPGGEMLPGLALPKPIEGAAAAPDEASRETLIEDLRQALREKRAADAASIADALLVLDAKDVEVLELRATALELQGDHEGAKADRKRCCELGRASCCR